MRPFDRRLPEQGLRRLEENSAQCAWLSDILSLWKPSGETLRRGKDEVYGLRLAIRDSYVNFYRSGQSIAEVRIGAGPRARIHTKYITGDASAGQTYEILQPNGTIKLKDKSISYSGMSDLEQWIRNANAYFGNEKDFVDDIVAENPHIIDLEMGLPSLGNGQGTSTASRIDIVALEPKRDGWAIVFWEAKSVSNSGLKSRTTPKVVGQLEKYRTWLRHDGVAAQVVRAYQSACRTMVRLEKIAARNEHWTGRLSNVVRGVATGDLTPTVDFEPRVLVDARTGLSAADAGHLAKLSDVLPVRVIAPGDDLKLGPI